MFAIGAIALAVGAILLGSLTTPPPQAAPETTTTTTTDNLDPPIDYENFTIAEIARGTPLQWNQVHSVFDGFPLALLEHQGWSFVFATAMPSFAAHDEGGLEAWRSNNGVDWEAIGQVVAPDHRIHHVRSTAQGLVAAGGGPSGGPLTVWRSNDGVSWTEESIENGHRSPNSTFYTQALGGNEHLLVVAATSSVDVMDQIQEVMSEEFGDDVETATLPWSPNGMNGEFGFVVWGPLGFPIIEMSAEDLDLTDEELATLESQLSSPGNDLEVWVSVEPEQWLPSELPDASWIGSITAAPNGEILATGWDNQRDIIWSTTDGFTWERIVPVLGPDEIEVWGGRLVGPLRSGTAGVVTSRDGAEWERIGPSDYLPPPFQWHMVAMASGPGGIAATVEGWSSSTFAAPDEPATLTDGDATLSIDYAAGSYRVEAGEIVRTWSMNSSAPPDGVEVDLPNESLTFHAETGEELASFTFQELLDAESEFWEMTALEGQHSAFVFTPNGADWTIQDPAESMDGTISLLEVTDTHVIAATIPSEGRFAPQSSPGFEIWSAPIP